jgi:hypothetical protein
MAPKASAASKGKAPERQPTVSPAPDEPGPSEHHQLAEIETQTPRHMDDGFSRQQLDTVQSMINSSITRSFELNLMPMIQSALEDVLNRRGSVSPTPAPADEQQPSLMPRRQPPLPPFHEPHEPHEYPYNSKPLACSILLSIHTCPILQAMRANSLSTMTSLASSTLYA